VQHVRGWSVLIAGSLLMLLWLVSPTSVAASYYTEWRYFPETGHFVRGDMKRFFDSYGGIDILGFPRTELLDDNGRYIQYFQRTRLEWNPKTGLVQPGLLGDELTTARRPFVTGLPFQNDASRTFYPQTKHSVQGGFKTFFDRRGGLAVFGYPTSDEMREQGFTVQYFQRARFEYHPELPAAYMVSLGLLGDQMITQLGFGSDLLAAVAAPRTPDLLGRGDSNFAGSPPERVTNLKLAAQRADNALIAPGAVYSFHDVVGPISTDTGYVEGLVIAGDRTVPGVGGGVCQVSTTAFRAAFFAGFPIVERHAHSYRVVYYEQGHPVGLDATIWDEGDFRFKNDTANYILVRTQVDEVKKNLSFLVYGVDTGRSVSMEGPVVTNVTPHGKDVYEQVSTLRPGETKQVDYAHDGEDVSVRRIVKDANGATRSDIFKSHYLPWQNVFQIGAGM